MRTATMESYGLSAENKKSTIALLADEVKDILSKNQVILLACWNNASTTTRKSSCRITDELSRDFIQARAQQHCGIRRHRHARKGRPCLPHCSGVKFRNGGGSIPSC